MIKHYVVFKYKEGYFSEEVFRHAKDIFAEITECVEGIVQYEVHKNCIVRDTNMDLMVILVLRSSEVLSTYLNHPAHVAYAQEVSPHVENRISFDCEI